jgi:cyclophilin family peptidyl-prolyl cis-trans isomerase
MCSESNLEKLEQSNRSNPVIYLDIKKHIFPPKRLFIQLYPEVAPFTCQTFLQTLTKSIENPEVSLRLTKKVKSSLLIFKNCPEENDYKKYFEDEYMYLKHETRGCLSTNNDGPDYNNPDSFLMSLSKNKNLDERHVVFAKVIQNVEALDYLCQDLPVNSAGAPLIDVKIVKFGVVLIPQLNSTD